MGSTGDWLHGHWNGNAGVAKYEEWRTAERGSVETDTDWLTLCGQNGGGSLVLVNGRDVGTGTGRCN